MTDTRDLEIYAAPSPLPPTEAELRAWHALSREEQVVRYREALQHPDRQRVSDASMVDVMARARECITDRRNG